MGSGFSLCVSNVAHNILMKPIILSYSFGLLLLYFKGTKEKKGFIEIKYPYIP